MSSAFRKEAREGVELLVRYRTPTDFGDFQSECSDLSRGGAFIRCEQPPPRGTMLRVQWGVDDEDGTPGVQAAARVVWRRERSDDVEPGMGVKFMRLHGDSERVLDELMDVLHTGTRTTPRKRIGVHARYRAPTSFEFVERQCFDLSEGGMFIATTEMLTKGTLLKFECHFNDGEVQLKGVALVMWTREVAEGEQPPGMGVRFVRLGHDGAVQLRKLLYSDPA